MAANYVQKFLDHAKLSTTSRYLNVNRDGMHAALERFEEMRAAKERGPRVAKRVANVASMRSTANRALRVSLCSESGLRGGRYRTRTYDLVRVKHAL